MKRWKVQPSAYTLELPLKVEHVHKVLHISQLRKYVLHSNQAIMDEFVEANDSLIYKKSSV